MRGLYHFESVCLHAEVWVVLVALDHTGLDASAPALDENLRTIHREQLYLLHLSDSPEKDLGRAPAELSLKDPGRGQQESQTENHSMLFQKRTGQSCEGPRPINKVPFPSHSSPHTRYHCTTAMRRCPVVPKFNSGLPGTVPPLGSYSALAECWRGPGRPG